MTKQKLKLLKALCYKERLVIINRLYQRGFTADQIASLFALTNKRIYHLLTGVKGELGTPTKRPRYLAGRDYIRWIVRLRDGNQCQLCLKKGGDVLDDKRALDVHHFDNKKENAKGYDRITELNEMITICKHCHSNLKQHRQAMKDGWEKRRKRLKRKEKNEKKS